MKQNMMDNIEKMYSDNQGLNSKDKKNKNDKNSIVHEFDKKKKNKNLKNDIKQQTKEKISGKKRKKSRKITIEDDDIDNVYDSDDNRNIKRHRSMRK